MERQYSYVPHTEDDIKAMLAAVGAHDIADLFADIPKEVTLQGGLAIPEGMSESEAFSYMERLSLMNTKCIPFLGCGIYDHIIPSAVKQVAATPALVTAYTPYQPEISQGVLQGIFEFQSMVCRLTGMQVSNASLYDGHTAAAEAAAMALQSKRKSTDILVSQTVHPFTRRVLETYYRHSGISVQVIPSQSDVTDMENLASMINADTACVILQSPNIFGILEDFTGAADVVHQHKALLVISSNPMTLGVCRSQGSWGADIAVGDTQPFGIPASFGGPTVGYIAATEKLLRKMPGRIVGETTDADGKRAFVLTLQAREQHIKRERATSNICSNQALAALASASYMALAGPAGIREAGEQCFSKAHFLAAELQERTQTLRYSQAPFFHEFTLDFSSKPRAKAFLEGMLDRGIAAGVHLGDLASEFDGLVAVAVTEKRTREEIDRYVQSAAEVLA